MANTLGWISLIILLVLDRGMDFPGWYYLVVGGYFLGGLVKSLER